MSAVADRKSTEEVVRASRGIILDIGCGSNKYPTSVGMDRQELPGVDVVHDWNQFPWPFEDGSVLTIIASHVVEHVNPVDGHFIRWMDEAWRVLRDNGKIALVTPYGGSALYWQDPTHCGIDGTEVLTESGFRKMQEVSAGDLVLTLDPETAATSYESVVRVIDEPYEGEILRFKNNRTDIAVTPNHDLLWHWRNPTARLQKSRADEFEERRSPENRMGIATVRDWKGEESPRILEWLAGDFMELLGWLLAEGGIRSKGNCRRVELSQSIRANSTNYERIKQLLDRLGLRYFAYPRRFDIDSPALYELMASLGPSPERFIPGDIKRLSKPLLQRLLEGLLRGDGERHPNGAGWTYTSTSQTLASDANEIALKCGFRSGMRIRSGGGFVAPSGRASVRRDQFRVSITPDRPMAYPIPQREPYEGRIVCVEAARNHTILTRLNGKCAWIGNCNGCTDKTWLYFCPNHPEAYQFYEPAPWFIEQNDFLIEGNMEVVLRKRSDDESFHQDGLIHYPGKGA